MITDEKTVKEFVKGYESLCASLGVYLVFEVDEYWLQGSGEQLDIDEAVQGMEDVLLSNGENAPTELT